MLKVSVRHRRCPRRILDVLASIVVALFSSQGARAEFSEEAPVHHFFNANLIGRGEHQISILGNYRAGVTETLEVGTQGVAFLAGLVNVNYKHRMFHGERYQTSFVGHTFYGSFKADGDRSQALFSMHGVTNTYQISKVDYLSTGLYDLYLLLRSSKENLTGSIHVLSPVVAYDRYLSSTWAFTAVGILPALSLINLESDYIDLTGYQSLFTGFFDGITSHIGFLTFTRSWQTFNLEMGALVIGGAGFIPYLNLFWRFHDP